MNQLTVQAPAPHALTLATSRNAAVKKACFFMMLSPELDAHLRYLHLALRPAN